jgi:hypothetical protein
MYKAGAIEQITHRTAERSEASGNLQSRQKGQKGAKRGKSERGKNERGNYPLTKDPLPITPKILSFIPITSFSVWDEYESGN